jgi:hypothetical protein
MSEIKSELSEVYEVFAESNLSDQQELTDFAQVYSYPQGICRLDVGEIDHEDIAHDAPYKEGSRLFLHHQKLHLRKPNGTMK